MEFIVAIVAIVIILWLLWFALLYIAVVFSAIGMWAITMMDSLAAAFTRLGIQNPIIAWFLLGAVLGAGWGAWQGLKRGGLPSMMPKVYAMMTVVCVLLIFLAWQGHPASRGSGLPTPTNTPTPNKTSVNTSQPLALVGSWQGAFSGHPAILVIQNLKGNSFSGMLASRGQKGVSKVRFQGQLTNGATRQIRIREVRVITETAYKSWSLGVNSGTVASDSQTIAGTGQDAKGNTYSWFFARTSNLPRLGWVPAWPQNTVLLRGTWRGYHKYSNGTETLTLSISQDSGKTFEGSFSGQGSDYSVTVHISGQHDAPTGFSWREDKIITSTGAKWSLGTNRGACTGSQLNIFGIDANKNTYSWTLKRIGS